MKNFIVEVKQVNSLYFELSAMNKKKAKQMINDLYSKIDINNLYLEPLKIKKIDVKIDRSRKT